MSVSDRDRDLIIRTVIGEAGSEPDDGKRAVANVIMNRTAAGRWGKTPGEVVLAKGQFEPWATRRRELLSYAPDSKAYRAAEAIVDEVLGGADDNTGGATHFYSPTGQAALGRAPPNWAQGDPLVIGRHNFYAPEGQVTRVAENKKGAMSDDALEAMLLGRSGDAKSSGYPQWALPKRLRSGPAETAAAADMSDDALETLLVGPKAPEQKGRNFGFAGEFGEIPAQPETGIKRTTRKIGGRMGVPLREVEDIQDNRSLGEKWSAAGAGAARGVRDVLDTGAEALSGFVSGAAGIAADNPFFKVIPKNWAENIERSAAETRAANDIGRQAYEAEYGGDPQAGVGRFVGQIAGTGPVLGASGRAVNWAGNKMLGAAGNIAPGAVPFLEGAGKFVSGRWVGDPTKWTGNPLMGVGSSAVRGAGEGAVAMAALSSASDKPLVEDMFTGAFGGGLARGGMRAANRALTGAPLPKDTAALAEKARDKFGIEIHPGQLSSSPAFRFVDSVVNRLPFSGGTKARGGQQAAFNRGVAATFGETAEKITPDVMASARQRIGQDFNTAAAKTPAIRADATMRTDLANIGRDAQQVLTPQEFDPFRRQVINIAKTFAKNGGAITGEGWQALTRKGAPLERMSNSTNPNLRYYANQVREVLNDVFERSAPSDVSDLVKHARGQWKAMKTVEGLAAKAADGDISPAGLMTAVKSSYGNMAYGGGGDLADLARIGQRFLKEPPSSGTAERSAIMNALLGAGNLIKGPGAAAAVGYAGSAAGLAPIVGAGGYAIAAPVLGKMVRSKSLTNKLIAEGLGGTYRPGIAARTAGALALPAAAQGPNRLLDYWQLAAE